MARVLFNEKWHTFSPDDTPRDVRKALAGTGMVMPHGVTDRSKALNADQKLGQGEYDFIRLVPGSAQPQQQSQQQQVVENVDELKKILQLYCDNWLSCDQEQRDFFNQWQHVLYGTDPADQQPLAQPRPYPVLSTTAKGVAVSAPLAPAAAAAAAVPQTLGLRRFLTLDDPRARLQHLLERGYIRVPTSHSEEGWSPLEPKTKDNGMRTISINKERLLSEINNGLVTSVNTSAKHLRDDGNQRVIAGDVWSIIRTDLHHCGFFKDAGTFNRTESLSSLEWNFDSKEEKAKIPESWPQQKFGGWLREEAQPITPGAAQPTTVRCSPIRGTRFGGDIIMVFGEHFTATTKFSFDWPYGGDGGWNEPATTVRITSETAAVVAPPLIDDTDETTIKVYVLASDDAQPAELRGEKGDATFTYELGKNEEDIMRGSLARLLLELDDYDLCPFLGEPAPVLSGQTIADRLTDMMIWVTEPRFLEYLRKRTEMGLFVPLMNFVDSTFRTVLHYLGGLRWLDALAYCLKQGAGACLGLVDFWGFTPLHYAVGTGDKDLVEDMGKAMSDKQKDLALERTRIGCDIYHVAGPDRGLNDLLRDLLERKPEPDPDLEDLKPKKKRRRKNAWDPNKDADVDISTVDDDGAIVL